MAEKEEYIPSFFKYVDGTVKINIDEYQYPKSEFNLKNEDELNEFIKTINILYNKCDDDRLMNDTYADDEYYKRDNIVARIYYYRQFDKSGIIDKLVDDVNLILDGF